ncbi:hypothetical protein CPB85DRAFT_527538 [Mucidula mucida]|nr:hypothetical protein CPB85DRAFT_527538 [Mucidula mucida]
MTSVHTSCSPSAFLHIMGGPVNSSSSVLLKVIGDCGRSSAFLASLLNGLFRGRLLSGSSIRVRLDMKASSFFDSQQAWNRKATVITLEYWKCNGVEVSNMGLPAPKEEIKNVRKWYMEWRNERLQDNGDGMIHGFQDNAVECAIVTADTLAHDIHETRCGHRSEWFLSSGF